MQRREYIATLSALVGSQGVAGAGEGSSPPEHKTVSTGVVEPEELLFIGGDGVHSWTFEEGLLQRRRIDVRYDPQGIQLTVDGSNEAWDPPSVGSSDVALHAGAGATLTPTQAREVAVALYAAAEERGQEGDHADE